MTVLRRCPSWTGAGILRQCAALGVVLALPVAVHSPYVLHLLTVYFIYLVLSIGLSLVVGYAGLLDLGYIAFFAIGAYTHALASAAWHWPFWVTLPLGACLAAALGVVLGFPTLRVRGDYLALVTLAFGEMVRLLMLNMGWLTQGPRGIAGIASPALGVHQLSQPTEYYYLAAAGLAAAVAVFGRVVSSHQGLIWEAIRDEETAARTCGLNSVRWLLLAFACGAAFAGTAGVMFAAIQRFISPDSFVLDESVLVMSIVVLSGGRSIPRMFIAAGVLCLAPELLRDLQQYRSLAFGSLLIAFTIAETKLGFMARQASKLAKAAVSPHDADRSALRNDSGTGSLRVESVTKRFAGVTALAGVNFEKALSRKCVALIGTNGAGKTTLLDCVSGVQRVDAGTIELVGVGRLDRLGPDAIARKGVGRTYQAVRVFSSMSVMANVLLGGLCSREGRPRPNQKTARELACAAIDFVGIGHYQDEQATALPIGVQRKVELARALAARPRVLLLDEPASGLNEAERSELSTRLRQVVDELAIPILLVEHDMAFVSRLADEVIVLDDGRVIAEGSPHEVLTDRRVIDAYLGSGVVCDAVNA